MKKLFTSEAIAEGARSGTIAEPQGQLNLQLVNPIETGDPNAGPTPETLFSAAYAACYQGALINAGEALGTPVKNSVVRVKTSLIEDEQGSYGLQVDIHAKIPGLDPVPAEFVMEKAHSTCPYSKAIRGNVKVNLIVDPA